MIHIESMGAQFHFCVILPRVFVNIRFGDETHLFLQTTYVSLFSVSFLVFHANDEVNGSKPVLFHAPRLNKGTDWPCQIRLNITV